MRHALVLTLALTAIALVGCGDSGAAGTYHMDADALIEAMMQQFGPMFDALPAEAREEAMNKMREDSKGAGFDLTLDSDGTFSATASMGDDPETINGKWSLEGESLTLTRVYAEGEEKDDGPDTMKGTLKNGEIGIKREAEMPFERVIKKK